MHSEDSDFILENKNLSKYTADSGEHLNFILSNLGNGSKFEDLFLIEKKYQAEYCSLLDDLTDEARYIIDQSPRLKFFIIFFAFLIGLLVACGSFFLCYYCVLTKKFDIL
jgi:hypothetical protein